MRIANRLNKITITELVKSTLSSPSYLTIGDQDKLTVNRNIQGINWNLEFDKLNNEMKVTINGSYMGKIGYESLERDILGLKAKYLGIFGRGTYEFVKEKLMNSDPGVSIVMDYNGFKLKMAVTDEREDPNDKENGIKSVEIQTMSNLSKYADIHYEGDLNEDAYQKLAEVFEGDYGKAVEASIHLDLIKYQLNIMEKGDRINVKGFESLNGGKPIQLAKNQNNSFVMNSTQYMDIHGLIDEFERAYHKEIDEISKDLDEHVLD